MPVSIANGARRLVILVVEDEYLIRCAIADHLRDAGYTVVETVGSASGWDVAERFRADRPNVSVLYTSGNTIDHRRCVPSSAFLAKPYQQEAIVSAYLSLRGK